MEAQNKGRKTAVILAFAALMAGFLAGLVTHSRYQARHTIEPKIDTIYVAKEAEISRPSPVESTPRPDIEPAAVPVGKVRISADSSAVLIEKETVTYRDTLAKGVVAMATITGVQPTLDRLRITYPEASITKTIYKPVDGWSLGVSASGAYTAIAPFITGTATMAYQAGPVRFRIDAGILYRPDGRQLSPYVGGGLELTLYRFK